MVEYAESESSSQSKMHYFAYWGKSRIDDEKGRSYHLLPYHCLDVVAVGKILLKKHKPISLLQTVSETGHSLQ